MTKEEILKMAEELYQEAFDAKSYFLILKQYEENFKKNKAEVQLSPAFYQIVFNALQIACFMELAKLYDKSKDVFSIGTLIRECQQSISLFPEYRTIKEMIDGHEYTFQIPYQHELKPEEKCFFKDQVKSQREILRLFNVASADIYPVRVDLKFSDFLDLYNKHFCALSKKQEHLRMQRNKIYAHNDKVKLSGISDLLEDNPIHYADVQELINFSLDVTRLIIACLTDINKPDRYVNINDWENTIKLVELGVKYRNITTNE